MAYYSIVEAVGTGDPQLVSVPPYLDKNHIFVYADGVQVLFFEWINSSTIRFTVTRTAKIQVVRSTSPFARLTQYRDGRDLPASQLNLDSIQAFYLAQEAIDRFTLSGTGASTPNPGGGGPPIIAPLPSPEQLLELLQGRITASQLWADLGSRIDLIDGPDYLPNSAAWRVAQEANARIDAVTAEADARAFGLLQEAISRGAAITEERTLREAADSSLSSRIDTVAAATGNNAAAIRDEAQARTDALSAEAVQRNLLAVQFRGSYTGTDVSQVTEGLLYNERIARANADSALAQQITALSASTGDQFDYIYIWYFDGSTDGWTGGSAVSPGYLRPATGSGLFEVSSAAGLNYDISLYPELRCRIRKTGSPTWYGKFRFHGMDGSVAEVTLPPPTFDATDSVILKMTTAGLPAEVNMSHVSVILSSVSDASNYFELDWVAAGRPSPGASSASLIGEQTARAAAVAAEATSRQILSTKMTGAADPTSLTLGSLSSGLLFDEKTARSAADGTLASSISSLQATVTANNNTLSSAITAAEVARASGDSTLAATLTTLQSSLNGTNVALASEATTRATQTGQLYAQWTVKTDVNGYVSGFGLASTNSNAGPYSSFIVRADSFAVGSPSGPGIAAMIPFIVQSTPGYVDGVYVPTGVYIDGLVVNRINATQIDTRGLTIKDGAGNVVFGAGTGLDISYVANRGAFATVNQLTAANISTYVADAAIGNAQIGGDIMSTNFTYGSAGWIIRRDGYAEFGNVRVRGDIQATSLTGNIVNTGHIQAGAVSGADGGQTVSNTTINYPTSVAPVITVGSGDPKGGSLWCMATGRASASGGSGSVQVSVDLLIDGVVAQSRTVRAAEGIAPFALAGLRKGLTGTRNVQLRMRQDVGGLTATVYSDATLIVLTLAR